jgi:hypothetical protein
LEDKNLVMITRRWDGMEAQEGLASHGKRRIGPFQMKRNAESALSQHAAGWRDLLKTKDFGWL